MTTVLLTGASGLCGRAIARELGQREGITLVTTSRRACPGRHVVHDLQEPMEPGTKGFPEQVNVIIHAAAEVDERSQDLGVLYRNLRASGNVASYAADAGATQVIHLSSVSIYGPASGSLRLDERASPAPATPYALSKLMSEQLLTARSGAAVANLRLAYVLGSGMAESTIVARFRRALAAGNTIRLLNADSNRLHFIDAADIARVCGDLIGEPVTATINLAAPERPTVRALLAEMQRVTGVEQAATEEEVAPDKVLDVDYGGERIRELLPHFRYRPFAASLRDALA